MTGQAFLPPAVKRMQRTADYAGKPAFPPAADLQGVMGSVFGMQPGPGGK